MQYLPLILFGPAFAVLAWLYWQFPRQLPRTALRRGFDLLALFGCAGLTASAVAEAFRWSAGELGLWPQVLATTVAFHVFPLGLLLAYVLRLWLFRPRSRG